MREYIRKFSGSIIGSLEDEANGDVTVRDFSGRILGYYRKSRNATTDYSGRTVAYGNCAVAFLFCDLSRIM